MDIRAIYEQRTLLVSCLLVTSLKTNLDTFGNFQLILSA